MKKFSQFGLKIKVEYSINDTNLMKKRKLTECDDPVFGRVITETEKIDDVEFYKHLKSVYDGLENCNKKFKYIDKNHWYIRID